MLRTESGQYRIRGLAVMAALRGITCESPQRADTEAIGALLYAALTQRWPYENDAHGLTGLPKGVGLIAPDQVRAGVHRGLSELAMRALINDGATASRQEPPCTTPEELAKAVAAMPRIRPPETAFSTPPPYQRTGYQQGSYRQPSGAAQASRATQPVPTPPPPLQSRTGRALKWSVSALLIAALGLGSWQLADTLLKREKDQDAPGNSQPASGPKKHTGKALSVKGATEFSPLDEPFKEEDADNVTDGSPSTAWVTGRFKGWPNFGNLPTRADGSGIIVDLGSARDISGIQVTMYRPGQTVEIRAAAPSAADPTTLGDFSQRISKLGEAGDKLDVKLDQSVKSRYVLVHITKLASDGTSDWFRGGISEIKIFS